MGKYNFLPRYRPGAENGPADALSRNPLEILLMTAADMQRTQAADPFCQEMGRWVAGERFEPTSIQKRWFKLAAPHCEIRQGVLTYRDPASKIQKLVATSAVKWELVHAAHATRFAGHGGVASTVARLRERYWWPFMSDDVAHSGAALHAKKRSLETPVGENTNSHPRSVKRDPMSASTWTFSARSKSRPKAIVTSW
jgi:hypothetical protein